MNRRGHWVLNGGLALALLGGLLWFMPAWLAEISASVLGSWTSALSLAYHEQHCQELDWQQKVLLERLTAKDEVTRELMEGRISFLQAADRFCDLNTNPSIFRAVNNPSLGATEEEQACRQVMFWVQRSLLRESTRQSKELLASLEQEMKEQFRQSAGLDLSRCPTVCFIPFAGW